MKFYIYDRAMNRVATYDSEDAEYKIDEERNVIMVDTRGDWAEADEWDRDKYFIAVQFTLGALTK